MIVDTAGLNFHSAKFYLGLLTKNGLLEFRGERLPQYKTTKKGMKTLECLKEIKKIISDE